MKLASEIQALTASFDQRIEFATELLSLRKNTRQYKNTVKELINVFGQKTASFPVKTAAAFLLAKLKVKDAIPALAQFFLEGTAPIGFNPGYLNYDAQNALLEIGIDSKPAIQKLLNKATDEDQIWTIGMMLFYLLKDTKKVETILKNKQKKRDKKGAALFKKVLKDLKKWKMNE